METNRNERYKVQKHATLPPYGQSNGLQQHKKLNGEDNHIPLLCSLSNKWGQINWGSQINKWDHAWINEMCICGLHICDFFFMVIYIHCNWRCKELLSIKRFFFPRFENFISVERKCASAVWKFLIFHSLIVPFLSFFSNL